LATLFLYSIFHGNLNYSSISPKIYDKIIDTCYWPVLDLIKEHNFCTGIEFPINTILKINEIDPLFLEELKKLTEQKKCEIICSGKEQTVFPLIPKDVNFQNLTLGKTQMEKLFDTKINTAYINEQLFSSSLTPLYLDAGIKNIITVWEWANKITHQENNKFKPSKIISSNGTLNVIWNSFISYQKFQRYINGEINKNDYLKYILKHRKEEKTCFPFYGSDFEIFGYKNPILGLDGHGDEIEKFHDILNLIEQESDVEFTLPSNLIDLFSSKNTIELQSARYAILGKKQDKFTVTRWATCGRDNGKSNAICYEILKKIRILQGMNSDQSLEIENLIDCWGSDFRTHANEEKYSHFQKITNILNSKLNKILNLRKEELVKNSNSQLILFNPTNDDWNGIPFERKLHFKPKTILGDFEIFFDGKQILSQIEDKKFYKDGSLKSAILVMEPTIKKKQTIHLILQQKSEFQKIEKIKQNEINTSEIQLSLLDQRGASISQLKFTNIHSKSLIGFLEHGTFNDTTLSPDFYSGHTVSFDKNSNKFTDLVPTEIFVENNNGAIRKKVISFMELPFGHLTKIFYLYENLPRLDIKYIFEFKNFQPSYFRIGLFTIFPKTFQKKDLQYSVHNGGDLSTHFLSGESFAHDESTDPRLSSNGCLGSTECMIDIGDNDKGITIFSDKSLWYSVPMINYHEVGDEFFYRVGFSLSELDDTTMTIWKGRKEISFSLLGRKENISNEKTCKMMFLNLICSSNDENIRIMDN